MLDDPASREVVVGPPAMGVTQTTVAPSPLQASASRLQVDEGTGLSEVETLQRRLAESEQKNKDLVAELKLVKKKLDKTPMSNNDLLLEELNQQVLRLTQELDEAQSLISAPQALLAQENSLLKQQLPEMTTEVKEMGGDLVRGLPENASFHLRIVNRNNRLDAMAAIFQKLWRYFGRSEPYPKLLDDWIGAIHKIPTITDWLRRSACRQGAFRR